MEPLLVDVAASPSVADVVIVVEPVYGVPAAALALEAGWGSVELAPAGMQGAPPIPLVSFEQPPPAGQQAGRCRVRATDLAAALEPLRDLSCPVLLGAPVLARPLCSRVAALGGSLRRLVLVPAPVAGEPVSLDAWWASGMLLRVLLDELADSGRSVLLTDAAGLAVTLARGAEDASQQLAAGRRWRDHLAAGGHADDLRLAGAVDSVGIVPAVQWEGSAPVARERTVVLSPDALM